MSTFKTFKKLQLDQPSIVLYGKCNQEKDFRTCAWSAAPQV